MASFGWLVALPLLIYFCPVWNSNLLCVLNIGLLAMALVFVLAITRELWILHKFRDM